MKTSGSKGGYQQGHTHAQALHSTHPLFSLTSHPCISLAYSCNSIFSLNQSQVYLSSSSPYLTTFFLHPHFPYPFSPSIHLYPHPTSLPFSYSLISHILSAPLSTFPRLVCYRHSPYPPLLLTTHAISVLINSKTIWPYHRD